MTNYFNPRLALPHSRSEAMRALRPARRASPGDRGHTRFAAPRRSQSRNRCLRSPARARRCRHRDRALGDEARVLDEIGRRIDEAGHQDLVVGDPGLLQILPLMGMARVGRSKRSACGRARMQVSSIVASGTSWVCGPRNCPADVHPHRLRRDVSCGVVERATLRSAMRRTRHPRDAVLVVAGCPRSGASICRMNPARWIASYSSCSASANASTYLSSSW